jgi:hypothetical protein
MKIKRRLGREPRSCVDNGVAGGANAGMAGEVPEWVKAAAAAAAAAVLATAASAARRAGIIEAL